MERSAWLAEMRRECERLYDQVWAAQYGETTGFYSNRTHQQFLSQLLSQLAPHSAILDAACGAGRYLPDLLEQGHSVVGIDQAQGMLERARQKFPQVQLAKLGLQEIAYQAAFDAILCIDAMENVCPEDWPLVLANFQRALKPSGYLYFTAETLENADPEEVRQAYEQSQQAGLPVVYGEVAEEDGVYHYHPSNQQVREWAQQAGFRLLHAANGEIWYYHVLCQKV